MIDVNYLLLAGSVLILASIGIAKLSDNLGVPTMLLFIGIGMLAGSEGAGGIYFDDPNLAKSIGVIALIIILFAGGLDTKWSRVQPVFWHASALSTVGVLITAVLVGLFFSFIFHLPLYMGLLLGAIISSTDAAAVFSVLRSKNLGLKGDLQPLLELESGSNDPMAVFLTVGLIQLITVPTESFYQLVPQFFFQMSVGGIMGWGSGKIIAYFLNNLKLAYEGIYPVFLLALAALVYSFTTVIGGSGFLAVYLAGMVVGNSDIVQKKSLFRFFDGMAWLSQIAMFVTLGLLVFPSRLIPVTGAGLLVSSFLMFVARPASVFLSLVFTKFSWKEKILIAWVGLRGAVPIILATFPLLAQIHQAELIFDLVFFTVLTSALFQGWSIPLAARWLGLYVSAERKRSYPIEFSQSGNVDTDLVDFIVPYHASVAGNTIVDLRMPQDSLIVLIIRNEKFIVPSGGTLLEEGDTILALVNKENLPEVRRILSELKERT